MTSVLRLALPVAAFAALAACSSPSAYRPTAPAPAVGAPPAAETGAETSTYGTGNTGGTYPDGKPSGAKAGQAGPPAEGRDEEGVVVLGPDGSVWFKPGATSERYRSDMESCYAYARAQVAHDARIESDSGAALPDSNDGSGLSALRNRMNQFERNNREPILFSKCMEAKGYNRQ